MAKKGNRIIINLACTECKRLNYISYKNRRNSPDRMELKKFCKWCKSSTMHKERK